MHNIWKLTIGGISCLRAFACSCLLSLRITTPLAAQSPIQDVVNGILAHEKKDYATAVRPLLMGIVSRASLGETAEI